MLGAWSYVVGSGVEMPRRIHMGAVVGRQGNGFHCQPSPSGGLWPVVQGKSVPARWRFPHGFGISPQGFHRMVRMFVVVDSDG